MHPANTRASSSQAPSGRPIRPARSLRYRYDARSRAVLRPCRPLCHVAMQQQKSAPGPVMEGSNMRFVHLIIAAALLEYLWFGFAVGKAREKYAVQAPATTGNEIFELNFRVQMN